MGHYFKEWQNNINYVNNDILIMTEYKNWYVRPIHEINAKLGRIFKKIIRYELEYKCSYRDINYYEKNFKWWEEHNKWYIENKKLNCNHFLEALSLCFPQFNLLDQYLRDIIIDFMVLDQKIKNDDEQKKREQYLNDLKSI
jgi:hypothetical protein